MIFVPERAQDRVRRDEVILADPLVVEAAEGAEQGRSDGAARGGGDVRGNVLWPAARDV